jgi:hypothetical protein
MGGSLEKIADELERIRRLMEARATVRVQARTIEPRRATLFWFVLMSALVLLWQIVRTGR